MKTSLPIVLLGMITLSLGSACAPENKNEEGSNTPAPSQSHPHTGNEQDENAKDDEVQNMKPFITGEEEAPQRDQQGDQKEAQAQEQAAEQTEGFSVPSPKRRSRSAPKRTDLESVAKESLDSQTEEKVADEPKLDEAPQKVLPSETLAKKKVPLWVRPRMLFVRSGPGQDYPKVGELLKGDKVMVLAYVDNSPWVRIAIIKSKNLRGAKGDLYVHSGYLSPNRQSPLVSEKRADLGFPKNVSQVFMIQNVATEMARIYQRDCSETPCKNRLIFETEMVAGEEDQRTRTHLGHYKIIEWIKFYQDYAGIYPSWYDPTKDLPPEPGSGWLSWTGLGIGKMRGAFGWYTAKIGPDARAQWTHGTLGWGSDGNKFIRVPKEFWSNLISDPRSHGCSRFDNPTISLVRQLMPLGSTILKVYALEGIKDPMAEKKPNGKWRYILTKNGVREDGQKSSRNTVLKQKTPKNQWLEEGVLKVDRNADAVMGNLYDIPKFHGILYVDAGLLYNYEHPEGLEVGGVKGEHAFPEEVLYENSY